MNVTVLSDSGDAISFSCQTGQTVYDAAEEAGFLLAAMCQRGGCGACAAEVLSGDWRYEGPVSQSKRKVGELLCRMSPVTELIVKPIGTWSVRTHRPWTVN